MNRKRILITGAGSGFGELAAIGLAQQGHDVIAGVQIWPQATALRRKVETLGLKNLRVEKLDLLHPYDVQNALNWDIDTLVNNAAIAESGPITEIPMELLRRMFEGNFFAPLELTQRFVRKFIDEGRPGKIVFTSSIGGLISIPLWWSVCRDQACVRGNCRVDAGGVGPVRHSGASDKPRRLSDRFQ